MAGGWRWVLFVCCGAVVLSASAGEPQAGDGPTIRRLPSGAPVTPFVFDGDVRDLPRPAAWRPGDPVREVPQRVYLAPGASVLTPAPPLSVDPLLARQLDWVASPARFIEAFGMPSRNVLAQDFTGASPPDTVGDVGPAHYIHMVNASPGGSQIRIFDKSQPVPTELATFLFNDLHGACQGIGDPIVQYDRQADRWLMGQLGDVCVAISITNDPVSGGWYIYDLGYPGFPDYPKYAVWPTDADGGTGSYVVTFNDDLEGGIMALERGAMLNGLPAGTQSFQVEGLPGFIIQGPTPADPDGPNPPPDGAAAVVLRHRDTEVHGGPVAPADVLEGWSFDVSWADPADTTLTPFTVDVAEFDSDICGLTTWDCFVQPDSTIRLMPLREVITNRLQYMNHGSHESLVGNLVVDVDTTDHAGIRWFELRRLPGGDWLLEQEGTFSADADNRWMGASSMDREGNIALGYNVVSDSTFPGLRYTGRQWFDPPGVMTQPEVAAQEGAAPNPINRYGDYAAMSLDPADDCTFWLTGEYNVSHEWSTRIVSFAFSSCECTSVPEIPVLQASTPADNVIELRWDDSATSEVVEYEVRRSRTSSGPYEFLATVADSSPGTGGGPDYVITDGQVSGGTTYYYVVLATDGTCRSLPFGEVTVTATGVCTLPPVFGGLRQATSATSSICRVDLSWDPAVPECGGPVRYNVYRSTTAGFIPGPQSLLAAGTTATAISDVSGLDDDVTYHYIVRAEDQAVRIEEANTTERTVTVGGPGSGAFTLLDEKFEGYFSFDDWTVTSGPGPHRCGDWHREYANEQRPASGFGYYALALSEDCGPIPMTSTKLDSEVMDLDIAGLQSATLEQSLYYEYLDGDDATIEVWDGSSWQVVWTDPDTTVDQHVAVDVTPFAIGNPAFQVRFSYQNAANDRWFAVDDIQVKTVVDTSCAVSSAPPPAPDGSGGSVPLRGARLDPTGASIAVTWDGASCPATRYNLLYGDLAGVTTLTLLGSACDIGAGSYTWNGVPAGDLFFLVVGADAAVTESSWGHSTNGERNGLDPSGACSTTLKDIAAACP